MSISLLATQANSETFCPFSGPCPGMSRLYPQGEVATADCVPALGVGNRRECRGYVVILPSSGSRRRQG